MIKRFAATVPTLVLSYVMLGSVVFTGISLSSKLMGRWRVVKVFGGQDFALRASVAAFGGAFAGGVFVGGIG